MSASRSQVNKAHLSYILHGYTSPVIAPRTDIFVASSAPAPSDTIHFLLNPLEEPNKKTQKIQNKQPELAGISQNNRQVALIKRSLICKHPECNSVVVSKGLCVRHGGGSRCSTPGCEKGAKLHGKCFHHGGSKLCKVEGCTSKAKRFGCCWAHGGGNQCNVKACTKMASLGGLCWAHGGGNRCVLDGCSRRSYQKHNYLCNKHCLKE